MSFTSFLGVDNKEVYLSSATAQASLCIMNYELCINPSSFLIPRLYFFRYLCHVLYRLPLKLEEFDALTQYGSKPVDGQQSHG
jgi:hypothetical protein